MTPTAPLTDPGATGDNFGLAVAVTGMTAVVTAYGLIRTPAPPISTRPESEPSLLLRDGCRANRSRLPSASRVLACGEQSLPKGVPGALTRRIRSAAVGTAVAALLIVSVTSAAVGATSDGLAGGREWPMFHGGFTHSGASRAVGPTSAAHSWTFTPGGPYVDDGISPVVGPNGTVYLLQGYRRDSRLVAMSPTTHKTLWTWYSGALEGAYRSTPAVAPDGDVYVVTDNIGNELIAIKNGGATLWTLGGLDLQGSPTIGPDGTIYVQTEFSELYAVNPQDGHVYWQFAGSVGAVGVRGSPAISTDGKRLYLPSGGGDLYALSTGPSGGRLFWTYHIQGPKDGDIENAPAVGPDGTIYVATGGRYGSTPGDIEAVNPDGTLKWAYVTNGTFETTPAVTAAGQVVAGNDVGTVFAVRQSDGKLAWSYSRQGKHGDNGFYNSSAASDADGNIYIQNSNRVFAISPKGSVLWTAAPKENYVGSSPAIDDSGILYVAADQQLIAYEPNS
jgi:outer membrane protein assembly factor BamB